MSRAAIRYAKAMLDQAGTKGSAAEVNNDMQMIAKAIFENRDLSGFLRNPVAKPEVARNVLMQAFEAANPLTKSLFNLLASTKRFEILQLIALEYNRLYDEMNAVQVAKVTTAVPLDSELESKILGKVKSFTDKKVVIENTVDPSIIGGFILRIGDKQYNASVAGRLQSLKKEFTS